MGGQTPASQIEEQAEAEVRRRVGRRAPERFLELCLGVHGVARHHQRRGEPIAERGVVRFELEPCPERRLGPRPLAVRERLDALNLVRERVLEQRPENIHERVRHGRLAAALPLEMGVGTRLVSEPAIRHGQRIVQAQRPWIGAQGPFQTVDRTRVALSRQRRVPRARQRRRRAGLERQGAGEDRVGVPDSTLIEVAPAEPEQGGDIGRLELECAREELGRLRTLSSQPVEMPQVVGPAPVPRRQ